MDLPTYIAGVLRRRFAYGDLDCCTLMADWLVAQGCEDPMADRRGTYASHDEFRRAMRSEGGLLRSCEKRFAAIGLIEVKEAQPGDVCLVSAPLRLKGGRVRWGATGAIAVTERLRAVVTADAGLVVSGMTVARAWRPCLG